MVTFFPSTDPKAREEREPAPGRHLILWTESENSPESKGRLSPHSCPRLTDVLYLPAEVTSGREGIHRLIFFLPLAVSQSFRWTDINSGFPGPKRKGTPTPTSPFSILLTFPSSRERPLGELWIPNFLSNQEGLRLQGHCYKVTGCFSCSFSSSAHSWVSKDNQCRQAQS